MGRTGCLTHLLQNGTSSFGQRAGDRRGERSGLDHGIGPHRGCFCRHVTRYTDGMSTPGKVIPAHLKRDSLTLLGLSVRPNSIPDGDTRAQQVAQTKLAECTWAIQRDPANPQPYLARSDVHASLKAYDAAAADLTTLVRLDPAKTAFYLFRRHLVRLYQGRPELALTDIEAALEQWPAEHEHNEYYKFTAYVHHKLGSTDRALELLAEAIRRAPKQPRPYRDRAGFYESIGRLEEAIADVSKAIDLEPEFWRKAISYHDRTKLYIKAERFEQALADCNFCIRKEPRGWVHYSARSNVYVAMGNIEAAEADYIQAMDLNPSMNR
jgi:tetratricopeptide (TPR) repeat protein